MYFQFEDLNFDRLNIRPPAMALFKCRRRNMMKYFLVMTRYFAQIVLFFYRNEFQFMRIMFSALFNARSLIESRGLMFC